MADRKPVIMAVDDDAVALAMVEDHLRRRYESDYEVVCERSCETAQDLLKELRDDRAPVALVLAGLWSRGLRGDELLARVSGIHPHARRALLIDWGAWGDRDTSEAIVAVHGQGRDRLLHPQALADARRALPPGRDRVPARVDAGRAPTLPREIAVVGERVAAPRARAAQPARPQRHGPRVPPHRLGARHGAARRGRARRRARAGRGPHEREVARRSHQRPAGRGLWREHRAGRPGRAVRRDRGGRRAGRAGVLGLRLVRGPQGAHHRARVDRRAGRRELADPQLPRLRARGRRRGPRPARLSAGLGLRLALPADVGGRVAAHGARPARARDRRRRGAVRADRGARHRRRLPPARHPGARGAGGLGRLTTGLPVRRHRRRRAGTRSCSAAATRPARPRCTCRATPSR